MNVNRGRYLNDAVEIQLCVAAWTHAAGQRFEFHSHHTEWLHYCAGCARVSGCAILGNHDLETTQDFRRNSDSNLWLGAECAG